MTNYSFIIPHHNSPDLLRRCLDSIPQRDDIEIIVADDNSDEDKRPSIDRGDVQLITITKEESKGAGHARNVAMTRATGKWLLFADCDDFYLHGFINILDRYLESDNDVIYFNVDSVETFTLKPSFRARGLNRLMNEYDGSKATVDSIKYLIHSPWDKMVRHDFIRKYDIMFEEVPKGNDLQFGFVLGALAEKVAVEKDKVYVITVNPYGITFGKKNLYIYIKSAENLYKMNYFFDYIGHPEWRKTVVRYTLQILKNDGFFLFIRFIIEYCRQKHAILCQADKYVKMIEEKMNIGK